MTDPNRAPERVSKGVPTGGQFAASARTEAALFLPQSSLRSPSGVGTGEFVHVGALDVGDRFVHWWGDDGLDVPPIATVLNVYSENFSLVIDVAESEEPLILDHDDEVELAATAARTTSAPGHPGASDEEYEMPESAGYGATRQTTAPIRPSHTSVDPRRAKGFYEMIRDGEIDLNPPYQRASVWGMDQKVNLIRSFLSQTPVPAVLINNRRTPAWAAANDGDTALETPYVVIDGKQRLETVRAWFAGEFGVPKSWFTDDEVVDYFQTPDGPYVNYQGLALPVRRDFDQNAILPVGEATVATIEEEAEMYVRVNSAGTEQTAADMDNARAWADGTARD